MTPAREMAVTDQEFGQILNLGIQTIRDGQGTIDLVLAQHPDHAAALRPPLEAAEWLHARSVVFDPRPGFISSSCRRLVQQIELESRPSLSKSPSRAWFWERLRPNVSLFQFVSVLSLAILLFFLHWTLTIAAKNAIPGDPLYKVKLAQEQIRLVLSFTTTGDSRLQADFTRQRLVEISLLMIEERYDRIPAAVKEFESQLGRALQALNTMVGMDEQQARSLSADLARELSEESETLTAIAEGYSDEESVEVQRALQSAAGGLYILQNSSSWSTFSATQTPTWTPTPKVDHPALVTSSPSSTPPPSAGSVISTPTEEILTPTPVPELDWEATETIEPVREIQSTEEPEKKIKKPKPANPRRPAPKPTNENRPDNDP